jgi:hypothetical protein
MRDSEKRTSLKTYACKSDSTDPNDYRTRTIETLRENPNPLKDDSDNDQWVERLADVRQTQSFLESETYNRSFKGDRGIWSRKQC